MKANRTAHDAVEVGWHVVTCLLVLPPLWGLLKRHSVARAGAGALLLAGAVWHVLDL